MDNIKLQRRLPLPFPSPPLTVRRALTSFMRRTPLTTTPRRQPKSPIDQATTHKPRQQELQYTAELGGDGPTFVLEEEVVAGARSGNGWTVVVVVGDDAMYDDLERRRRRRVDVTDLRLTAATANAHLSSRRRRILALMLPRRRGGGGGGGGIVHQHSVQVAPAPGPCRRRRCCRRRCCSRCRRRRRRGCPTLEHSSAQLLHIPTVERRFGYTQVARPRVGRLIHTVFKLCFSCEIVNRFLAVD